MAHFHPVTNYRHAHVPQCIERLVVPALTAQPLPLAIPCLRMRPELRAIEQLRDVRLASLSAMGVVVEELAEYDHVWLQIRCFDALSSSRLRTHTSVIVHVASFIDAGCITRERLVAHTVTTTMLTFTASPYRCINPAGVRLALYKRSLHEAAALMVIRARLVAVRHARVRCEGCLRRRSAGLWLL